MFVRARLIQNSNSLDRLSTVIARSLTICDIQFRSNLNYGANKRRPYVGAPEDRNVELERVSYTVGLHDVNKPLLLWCRVFRLVECQEIIHRAIIKLGGADYCAMICGCDQTIRVSDLNDRRY